MDKKTVSTISYLSRLKLDEDNQDKITSDLENIIKFVDQLNDADVNDIEPLTSPLEKVAKTRADAVTAENRKDEYLERVGANFEYYPLLGDRKPPLDYRN